jgi:hypothetical protein
VIQSLLLGRTSQAHERHHDFGEKYVTQAGFIAAMAADITLGSYNSPVTLGKSHSKWVIVSCWGPGGDFLSLSLTQTPAAGDVPQSVSAPRGLQPEATHLGLLTARNVTDQGEETEYLLVRHQPMDVPVGGIFHPSDGYVRVLRQGKDITLVARGRYAHCVGEWEGQPIVRDIPHPAPGYEQAQAWHLKAVRRPWIGDFPTEDAQAPAPDAATG